MTPARALARSAGRTLALAVALALIFLPAPPAAAQEYTIGPRDVLRITVWSQADLSKDYTVGEDGIVHFPLIGAVKAAGLTPPAFADRLRALLEEDYLVDPQVEVMIAEYRSRKVQVLGEADKPGLFYLQGGETVLDVISRAGGLGRTAGTYVVLVRPTQKGVAGATETTRRLSLPKIRAGDLSENLLLQDGDTILIPKAEVFFVVGEVTKPGAYQLVKETSVLEAIAIAGGFTPKAAPARTRVIRRTAEGTQDMAVDMNEINRKGTHEKGIRILEDDVIMVPESFF